MPNRVFDNFADLLLQKIELPDIRRGLLADQMAEIADPAEVDIEIPVAHPLGIEEGVAGIHQKGAPDVLRVFSGTEDHVQLSDRLRNGFTDGQKTDEFRQFHDFMDGWGN